jgi:DNA-binding MurR/RpiR family transcriptional regulator
MATQDKEIFARILERYDTHMTAAEKRIADHLLKHPHEGITLSVATLARRAGTSEATVVRFAKTMGFAGFLDFKQELLRRASRDLAGPARYEPPSRTLGKDTVPARSGQHGSQGHMIQPALEAHVAQVADSAVVAIAETLAALDPAAFQGMVTCLRRAHVVYTIGSGLSSFVAQMAAFKLTMVGKRAIALPESGSRCACEDQLRLADPKHDVLLAFSFPPYSKDLLALSELAAGRGLEILAFTDRRQNPLARVAAHTLVSMDAGAVPPPSLSACGVLLSALFATLPTTGAARSQAQSRRTRP